ncbi:unnamed protein product, partial [Coffea canephora]
MPSIVYANLSCINLVVHLSKLNKTKKKWGSAFLTIYCSRAFKNVLSRRKSKISPVPSQTVIINIPEVPPSFCNVDQTTLTKLVKEKSLGQLDQLGGWYDGGSIFVAVFLVISVSAISNFRQSRQFEKLSKVSSNIPVEVVRNGRRQQISIFEIVVGDVVRLKIGDQVPADGLLLEGHSLSIDESSMTGESDHLEVNQNQNPFLTSGTKVADGYGQMLVTSVGMNTTWGEMMSSVSQDSNEKTPLQSRLNKLTSAIGKVGLAVAFLVLLVLLADDVINAVVKIIAAAVTIVVVAIPEGLPLAVTLTLAYSMKRMMADQAMVRKLSACETMGSATTICTDKTGTLTLNRMTVTKFWLGKESVEKDSYLSISTNVLKLLREAVSVNTTGSVYRPINLGTEGLEFSGSPTEKAILSWAVMELNMDMERVKQNCSILH